MLNVLPPVGAVAAAFTCPPLGVLQVGSQYLCTDLKGSSLGILRGEPPTSVASPLGLWARLQVPWERGRGDVAAAERTERGGAGEKEAARLRSSHAPVASVANRWMCREVEVL